MKLEPFNRQISVFLGDLRSPKARSERLARHAREGIEEIRRSNKAATGFDPTPRIHVDGREGVPLSSVRPDGVIVANFDPLRAALEWIGEQLLMESPRLTGRYVKSHVLEVDGVEWDMLGPLPDGEVYRFRNKQPYSRKLEPKNRSVSGRDPDGGRRRVRRNVGQEPGMSPQAPDGIYAAVSAVAQTRFGDIARIDYTLNNFDPETGVSHPAIRVRPF